MCVFTSTIFNFNSMSTLLFYSAEIFRCVPNNKLIPGNRFEYDYGSQYKFNTSTPTVFTRGLEKVTYIIHLHRQ